MSRSKSNKPSATLIDQMLAEASWLLSHAQALGDYGRRDEADAELARAALCEEQVACLLDADGQQLEASIHRASAASCYETLGQYTKAVTLARAALSGPLIEESRGRVEERLALCLARVQKEVRRPAKRGVRGGVSSPVS